MDQAKMDLVARLGGAWYCRVSPGSLFRVAKPFGPTGIGVDQLPEQIRLSPVLTGNHLGQLANVEKLPAREEVEAFAARPETKELLAALAGDKGGTQRHLHLKAAELLDQGEVNSAWMFLLQGS